MSKRSFRTCLVFLIVALASTATLAGTLNYEYDALGRLKEVDYPNGSVVSYTLDPAGNRTEVASRTPPGVPASITVPSSSVTGNYTISWGAASGTLTAYELYEATNSGFSGQSLVYSGTALSKAISGKGSGTYYYRVRACSGSACGGYRTGSNPTTVTPPGVPASITVPSSSTTGAYTINWGTSTGTVTAYQLYEATNSGFTGQVQVYSGTGTTKAISGKGNGSYYYRVRACNGTTLCSGYRTGANPTTVNLAPPAAPASITGPLQNTTGNYSISWSSSTGASRYELWESINFSSFSKVYDGSSTFKSFTNKPNGEYTYKAKACNVAGCSGFSPTKFVQVCVGGCSIAPPDPGE